MTPAPSTDPRLSALVVCFDEGALLGPCLDALDFCDERVVVDLGSTDDSAAVARERGARVVEHPWVPVVEKVRRFATEQASHNWVVFMDPDMIFPRSLGARVRALVRETPDIACLRVSWRNYFGGVPVEHGRWGGLRPGYPAVFHRRRMAITGDVHAGLRPLAPHRAREIPPHEGDVITHHWAPSLEGLLQKHRRYVVAEAERARRDGWRFGRLRTAARGVTGFGRSLLADGGWRDGRRGLFLSAVWGAYVCNIELALRHLERHGDPTGFEGIPDRWLRWLHEGLVGGDDR